MSTSSRIEFFQGQSSLEELSGAQSALVNFLVDVGGAGRQRPGITSWEDFESGITNNSPVIGMYAWRTFLVFVLADRTIWAWYGVGDVRPLSSASAATQLDGTKRPIFAYDSQRIVITGGGATQKWEGIGLSSRLGGSPPNATHIAYNAQRFVVNAADNSGIIYWTPPGVGNHEIWDTTGDGTVEAAGAGFSEAEAAPDPVIALHANSNEVFAFGTQTTQVFVADATVSFAVGASLGVGCSASYSIIDTDQSFAWLDEHRRFVYSSGREFDAISSPAMTKDIGALGTVSDCWGTRIRIGSWDLLLWVLPTEGRALYFDRDTKKWGEWRSTNGEYWAPWIGQSYYYWADKNLHLVGLSDGRIGVLTFDSFQDDGRPIKCVARPGFQDWGSLKRKSCERVQLQMKRGATLPGESAPEVELRYRDGLGAFRSAIRKSLGAGDYNPVVDKYALGMYRARQYELVYNANAEFVLTGAMETFTEADS